jgi:hypothetical protein
VRECITTGTLTGRYPRLDLEQALRDARQPASGLNVLCANLVARELSETQPPAHRSSHPGAQFVIIALVGACIAVAVVGLARRRARRRG